MPGRRKNDNPPFSLTSKNLKGYFITGLIILLPLALTLAIVQFLFNFLTAPFAGAVASFFNHYKIMEEGFLFFSGAQVQHLVSQVLILFAIVGTLILLGLLTTKVFFHYFLQVGESFVKRIPFIRGIYKTTQDVVKTLFTTKADSFKQVVMVPFPSEDSLSLGLITSESITGLEQTDSVSVFVPTTPNPTSGFLMVFHKKDLLYLDMSVEDAFKFVVSCGVVCPSFNIIEFKSSPKMEDQ